MKNKLFILLLLLLAIPCNLFAQQWDWAVDIKSVGMDNYATANAMTTDKNGNLYYHTYANNNFYHSSGEIDSIIPVLSERLSYIVKVNRNGRIVWKSLFPKGLESLNVISVDNKDVFIAASQNKGSAAITFGSSTLPAVSSAGFNQAVLLRYDMNGTPLEIIPLYKSKNPIYFNSFYVVNDTQIVAFANVKNAGTNYPLEFPNTSIYSINNNSTPDWILFSLTKNGNLNWYKNVGHSDAISYKRMVAKNNYIYLAAPTKTKLTLLIRTVYKIDLKGTVLDSNNIQSLNLFTSNNWISSIYVDENENLYIGGRLNDSVTIDAKIFPIKNGSNTPFLAKFNKNLNLEWLWTSVHTNTISNDGSPIFVDKEGNVYWNLPFKDSISISGELIDGVKTGTDNRHSVILKFNPSGQVIDKMTFNDSNLLSIQDILPDYKGNFYISGFYSNNDIQGEGSLSFGPFNFKVRNSDHHGYFYAKYGANRLSIDKNIICYNDSIKAVADTIYKDFLWVIDDTLIISGKSIRPQFNITGKHKITLHAFESDSTESIKFDTFDFYRPIEARLALSENVQCRYISVIFRDSSILDNLPIDTIRATIIFGDGTDSSFTFLSSQTPPNIPHNYSDTGIFEVSYVIRYKSCIDTLENKSYIKVIDAPRPGIMVNPITGCTPLEVKISRSYKDSILNLTYVFGDGTPKVSLPVLIDTAVSHTFFVSGKYTILQTLTGQTGCITTDSITINVLQGFIAGTRPELLYTTIENNKVSKTVWDSFPNTQTYTLIRSENKLNWVNLATFTNNDTREYYDSTVKVSSIRYFYKVIATDICNLDVESNLGSTLLLSGKNYDNEYSIIEWTPYENWGGGIKEYNIEKLNPANQWQSISPSTTTSFKDNNFGADIGLEECYRITAYPNIGVGNSQSNIICLPIKPVIWIPNGFTPNNDGLNDTFSISTLGIKKLTITIYNSYGEEIYSCNGVDCNWNGEHKGVPCIEGVYSYIVSARTGEDKLINHRGTITLLR